MSSDKDDAFRFGKIQSTEGVSFFGRYSADFIDARTSRWRQYHPDIRYALTARNIVPLATQDDDGRIAKARKDGSSHFLTRRIDGSGGLYIVDAAPARAYSLAQAATSFDKAIATGLDHIFGFSTQAGFEKTKIYRRDDNSRGTFTALWANLAAKTGEGYYNERFEGSSSDWVAANAPSAFEGFSLPAPQNSQTDRVGRTPLENMLWPGKGRPGVSSSELAALVRAGANPFQINHHTDKSVAEIMMERKENDRLLVVIRESSRRAAPFPGLDAAVKRGLETHVEFEFSAETRSMALKAVKSLSVTPGIDIFGKRPSSFPENRV